MVLSCLRGRPGECSVARVEAAYISLIIRGDEGGLGLAWGSNGGAESLPSGQPGGSCGLQQGKGLPWLSFWTKIFNNSF